MKKIQLIVIGASGRLGKAIVEAAHSDEQVNLKASVVRKKPLTEKMVSAGDVIVDASSVKSVEKHLSIAMKKRAAYVLAVTGLDQKIRKKVELASQKIPIVIAPNLSLGVAVLRELTMLAASLLPSTDVEIVESHHRNKQDAPSGTALMLATSILESSRSSGDLILGRRGMALREPGSIGIHSMRGGDVVGEHRVHFFLDGDRIELAHQASHRSIFAKGAIRTAKFIASSAPGLYTLRDVLFGGSTE